MNSGKTIFSQLMDFLPRQDFRQCVDRYRGNYKLQRFSCWDQFLCMAFAQLTYRESLARYRSLSALGGHEALSHGHSQPRLPATHLRMRIRCVFQSKSSRDSDRKPPLIPIEVIQRFRGKASRDSDPKPSSFGVPVGMVDEMLRNRRGR